MAADPEAIFQEVLSEEQAKGVTGAVAEARAKAARARAEHGSPHPKEPKWWPGAQPHLEGGGDGAAAVDQDEVEEATAVEETPVAEAAPPPAEPAPAPQPPDVGQEEVRPVPDVAPEPVGATAPQPVAAAAAVATEAPAAARPSGVTHGTPTGNRLRPEDSVTTDVQLDAQQAIYQRRKLIDEVVATGVPAVAASGAARSRTSPLILLLYLLIPLLAVMFVIGSEDNLSGSEPPETPPPADGGGGLSISAVDLQFSEETLQLPADEETELEFVNDDAGSIQHNVAIYEEEGGADIFVGEVIPGGQSVTYSVPAIEAGEYYFQCDVHPGMNGSVAVQ